MSEEIESLQKLGMQPSEFTTTFSNPICKQTYNSLPRIYGKKKRPKLFSIRDLGKPHQNQSKVAPHYFSANQQASVSAHKNKAFSTTKKLSQPKNHFYCGKSKCSCNQNKNSQRQRETSQSKIKIKRKIVLPEICKFQLEDLESQHKIIRKENRLMGGQISGLQKIINDQKHHHEGPESRDTFNQNENTKNMKKPMKTKYSKKAKPIFNTKYIQQQSDEEEEVEKDNSGRQHKYHRGDENSHRFKTQMNDSSDNSGSISISSFVFKNSKQPNTNYHKLNKNERNFQERESRSRVKSILSNGLFRIPEQPEYIDYLKGYRNQDPDFKVKSLVKSPAFKIIKEEKDVYFGEVNQKNQKHGSGLLVSQKQIFEGKYQKNLKIQGYERNVDGVYKGGFMNGLRYGHGTFKWNNGQIFEGNWEAGMKNGYGVWKSPKGDYYEGQWKNNRQNGKGTFKHKTSTYKGYFENFLKHGYGQETFINGDRYIGNYEFGKPHGKGRYEWHKGGYYQGMFCKGLRQGKGIWVDEHQTKYEGNFKQDSKHGSGKEEYKTGQKFTGQFWEGARKEGILIERSGSRIQIKGE